MCHYANMLFSAAKTRKYNILQRLVVIGKAIGEDVICVNCSISVFIPTECGLSACLCRCKIPMIRRINADGALAIISSSPLRCLPCTILLHFDRSDYVVKSAISSTSLNSCLPGQRAPQKHCKHRLRKAKA